MYLTCALAALAPSTVQSLLPESKVRKENDMLLELSTSMTTPTDSAPLVDLSVRKSDRTLRWIGLTVFTTLSLLILITSIIVMALSNGDF